MPATIKSGQDFSVLIEPTLAERKNGFDARKLTDFVRGMCPTDIEFYGEVLNRARQRQTEAILLLQRFERQGKPATIQQKKEATALLQDVRAAQAAVAEAVTRLEKARNIP